MKRSCLLLTIILILFAIDARNAFSQTGPGGVGNTTNTQLWLIGDKGVSTIFPTAAVWRWKDFSGNSRDFEPVIDDQSVPSELNGGINGHNCLLFNEDGKDFLGLEEGLGITGGGASTVVIVAMNTSPLDEDNSGLYLGQKDIGNPGEVRVYGLEYDDAVRFNGESQVFSDGHTAGDWKIISYSNPAGSTVAGYSAWLNGTLLTGSSASSTIPLLVNDFSLLGASQMNGVMNDEGYFDGAIAEVVVFSSELNDATKVIIDNNLAAKYLLSISDDHFIYEATHPYDVSGIAGYNGTIFTNGWSSTIMSINSPDDLSNNEYLLYGHNNGATTWTTTEVPASGTYRLAREWRIDETGSVGTVTVSIPASSLPAFPAGYPRVGILTDADGNFASGATMHEATLTAGTYNVSLDLTSGQHIAVVCFRPEMNFTAISASGLESVAGVTVQVDLNYPFPVDMTASYATSGTASNGSDYNLATSSVTIPSGSVTSTFNFTVTDDLYVEDDETVVITLTATTPGLVIGSKNPYTYTIIDNDAVFVSFSAATASENEGNVSRPVLVPTLRVSGGITTTAGTVTLTVTNGTATAADWSQTTAVITIPAGDYTTPVQIAIPSAALTILGETLVETDETINLNINTFTLVEAGAITSCTYTIVNDDNATVSVVATTPSVTEGGPGAAGTGTYTFTLSNPSAINRTVTYSVSGTATSGTDFVALPGTILITANTTSVTATLTTITDLLVEGDETVSVRITAITGVPAITIDATPAVMTIIEDDLPSIQYTPASLSIAEGASGTIEVWLANPPLTPVVLNISTIKAGVITLSTTTLTFTTANYATHQIITVQSVEDNMMGNLTDDVIISVNDALSNDLFDPLPNIDIPVTIINNDVADIVVSPSAVTVAENGTATFTVRLSAGPASGNVVVNLVSNNTAVATIDKASVIFNTTNWNLPQTVTVTGVNNNTIPNTSTTISLAVNNALSDDNYDNETATVTVNVTNDDVAGFTVTPLTLNLSESGPAGTFSIVLTAQPLTNVVLDLVNAAPAYVTHGAQVTFTTANWNVPQIVTVTPINDALDEDHTDYIVVTINQASSDDSFDALASKTVTINIDDNDPPVITGCPSNISATNGAGLCGAVVSWIAPTSTGPMVSTHNPGATFPVGVTTVTYTSTDSDGTSTCSFTVTVTDTQLPVFSTCPASINAANSAGTCSATIAVPNSVVNDNCAVSTLTWAMTGATTGNSPATGINQIGTYTFSSGTTSIVYTAKDASGNTATCSFSVTVSDNEAPVFTSCPAPIATNTSAGVCNASVITPVAVVTDNCGVISLTWALTGATLGASPAAGINQVGTYTFNKGVTTVTYTARDAAGKTAICSYTVTVTDTEKPVIACPGNINANNSAGICNASIVTPNATVSDNCAVTLLTWTMTGATVAASPATGINQIGTYTFISGITTVTYTVADAAGNNNTCSFTVSVTDTEIPSLTCPGAITVNNATGSCTASVITPNATLSDNCSVSSLTWVMTGSTIATSPATGINQVGTKVFNSGVTTITYTAKDAAGNTATCFFTVTVNDIEKPVINCSGELIEDNSPGLCTATIPTPNPIISDNCGMASLVWELTGATTGASALTGMNNLGTYTFNSGVTTVKYILTDISGNSATCSYLVTINDTEKPDVTCPGNLSATTSAGVCNASVVTPNAAIADNCGAVVSLTWTMTGATVANSPITGINQVGTYTFNSGLTTVTYTATDAAGNSDACSFTVTVTDNENPVISCPGNMAANNDPGICKASVSTTNPVATDNCGVTKLTWAMTGSTVATSPATGINQVGTYQFNSGTTTVTYTATDVSGNTDACSFDVVVTDTESPVVTCPGDFNANNTAGTCSASVNVPNVTATDNCGVTILTWTMAGATVASSPVTGINQIGTYTLNSGITTVQFTATDAAGLTATCSYDITVVDTEKPVVSCPADISANSSLGNCSASVVTPNPTVSDNCGVTVLTWTMTGATVASSPVTGINQVGTYTFNSGITTVTYTAIDAAGNSETCSFKVTVTDKEKPQITCSGELIVGNNAGGCSASLTIVDAVVNDNCGVVSLTWVMTGATTATSPAPGINQVGTYTYNVGETITTYTVRDAAGNSATCYFKVTVNDTEAPTITCAVPAASYPSDAGKCYYMVPGVLLDPVTIDNCGSLTVTNDFNGGSSLLGAQLPIGTTTVIWTVTDNSGLSSNCTQMVTVSDSELPVITCSTAITDYPADLNMCYATGIVLTPPVTSDNCGVASVVSDAPAQFNVGLTTVTWTVTDVNGSVNTCTQTVEVVDTQSPLIVCPGNITLPSAPGICGAPGVWTNPIATDNCPGMVITSNYNPGDIFPVGVTTVTYTATDGSGNNANCSFKVTVNDTQAPVIIPNDTTIYLDATGSAVITVADVTDDVSDNCALATTTLDKYTFDCSNIGPNTVTITATDSKALTSTATAIVTILDTISPVVSCKPVTAYLDATGNAVIAATDLVSGTATDNCSVATYTLDKSTFTCADLGDVPVILTAADASGNSSSCNAIVTVVDTFTVVVSAGPDLEVCFSDLSVSVTTANVYNGTVLWTTSGTGTFSDATNINPVYTFGAGDNAGVTLTVTATNIDGCTLSTDTDATSVSFVPVPVISAGSDLTVCTGSGSLTITDATSTGGTILWTTSGDGSFVDASALNPVYNFGPTDAGLITLTMTVTSGTCPPVSNDMQITFVASPIANAGTGSSLCASEPGFQVSGASHAGGTVAWSSSGDGVFDNIASDNPYYTFGVNDVKSNNVTLTMTVTGVGLCPVISSNVVVDLLPAPGISVTAHYDISCIGLSDGIVSITGTGGTPTYTYRVDGSAYQASGDFGSLTAGAHIFSVMDVTGCASDTSVTIVMPEAFTFALDSVKHIKCFGTASGAIYITPAGGLTPYDISWTGPGIFTSTAEDLTGLEPGNYSLVITDNGGCASFTLDTLVTEAPQLVVVLDTVSDRSGYGLTCNGQPDGFIRTTVSGGSGDLAISWEGPSSFVSTLDDIADLEAGTYTLTVTDTAGCFVTNIINLTQPAAMEITVEVQKASCPEVFDGDITINVSGGAGTLAFLWNDGVTVQNRTDIKSGDYLVTVTDMNGCSVDSTITVENTGFNCLDIPDIITPNGDDYNDTWILGDIELYPDIEVKVYTRWGKLVYSSRNPAAEPWDGTYKGKLLPNDSYHYIIYLNDGSEPRSGVISIISK